MAATSNSIDQFKEIYDLVKKRLDEKRKVLLVLDIDGVQDDARLEVEKVIANYLEKQSEAFKKYIHITVVPSVLSLCTELAHIDLIEYILMPELDTEDLKKILSTLEQSSLAKKHQHYLSYCELLKILRKIEFPTSHDTLMAQITEKITSNTALICAMHLSTAICATSPLAIADKSQTAAANLAALYSDFQGGGKYDSTVIQLTARTEAMARAFHKSLNTMLTENNAQLKSLAAQGADYKYNKEKFPLYPTNVITGSNIIAASRNDKDLILQEFLAQNGLLSANVHIIFVDDSASAHKDMKRLPTLPEVKCTLEPVLFKRNRSDNEKQALCVTVATRLGQAGLETAIIEYQHIWADEKVSDSAAYAVINNYVLDLLKEGIIDQDKIVRALNPSHQPRQSTSSARTWSNPNTSTHFSPPAKRREIEASQLVTDAAQP